MVSKVAKRLIKDLEKAVLEADFQYTQGNVDKWRDSVHELEVCRAEIKNYIADLERERDTLEGYYSNSTPI